MYMYLICQLQSESQLAAFVEACCVLQSVLHFINDRESIQFQFLLYKNNLPADRLMSTNYEVNMPLAAVRDKATRSEILKLEDAKLKEISIPSCIWHGTS